jgi:hypothetical protein
MKENEFVYLHVHSFVNSLFDFFFFFVRMVISIDHWSDYRGYSGEIRFFFNSTLAFDVLFHTIIQVDVTIKKLLPSPVKFVAFRTHIFSPKYMKTTSQIVSWRLSYKLFSLFLFLSPLKLCLFLNSNNLSPKLCNLQRAYAL